MVVQTSASQYIHVCVSQKELKHGVGELKLLIEI